MGRGGKIESKRNFKNRVRSNDKDSDDSDEDYVAEVEENVSDDDSEDLGNSLDEYASEESSHSFVDDEEEEEKFRKVVKSKNSKRSRANGKIGGITSRKRKRVSYEEEEEDEDYVNDEDDEEFSPDDYDDDDDDDDDLLDEDEELTTKKKTSNMKAGKKRKQKSGSRRGRKKRRKSRVSKKPLAKKGRKNRRLRKKERCEIEDEYEGDFIDDSTVGREKSSKNSGARRRRYTVHSDSDFRSSGSSDHEYSVSEEEREWVREASKLYRGARTNLRGSSSVKKIQENGDLCQGGKTLVRKGKEKVKEANLEVVKQVCGICLSEEDKRRFRGSLDCCSHFFCFACIMEWSKVESRCPLCKQRFQTITKIGRAAVGVIPRNVVIKVPKRDQVYQPSEEEIRSFIDPYENVICAQCHEGGHDALMLLCDLCDSPAHTFCVGLGWQVPEGNWYCDDCRLHALGSPSSQALDPLPDQMTTNDVFSGPSPNANNVEGLEPTFEPSPRTAFTQGFGNLPSPRFPAGDVQVASPVSGAGGPTLSQRRQLHRHIQNIISYRTNYMANRTENISGATLHNDLPNPHNDQRREATVQNSRTQDIATSQSRFFDDRLEANDHPSSSMQNGDLFSLRPSQIRTQALQDPIATTTDRSVNLTLWPELSGISSILGHDQFYQRNGAQGMVSEVNLSPLGAREESQFYAVKEQLQSMVKNHLKSLSQSQDIELGHDTFKEISRSSTHTILAACGLEHKRSEVHYVPAPAICTHGDRLIAGQSSILKGFCSSCFDTYAREVVKRIMDTRLPQWLSLGL